MLLLEKNRERVPVPLEKAPEPYTMPPEPADDSEGRLECLRRCLSRLSAENRDLIVQYYQGDKGDKIGNRKALSLKFALPAGTLRMRALRLRETLQSCAQECMRNRGGNRR
jgi:hypothetical protein